jgi:hypothetical protein
MPPTRPSSGGDDLFRERLDAMINMSQPLVKLPLVMTGRGFDDACLGAGFVAGEDTDLSHQPV